MVLMTITIPQCEEIANGALGFRSGLEVKKYLRRAIHKVFPGIDKLIK
jgi:hypothetical protein